MGLALSFLNGHLVVLELPPSFSRALAAMWTHCSAINRKAFLLFQTWTYFFHLFQLKICLISRQWYCIKVTPFLPRIESRGGGTLKVRVKGSSGVENHWLISIDWHPHTQSERGRDHPPDKKWSSINVLAFSVGSHWTWGETLAAFTWPLELRNLRQWTWQTVPFKQFTSSENGAFSLDSRGWMFFTSKITMWTRRSKHSHPQITQD